MKQLFILFLFFGFVPLGCDNTVNDILVFPCADSGINFTVCNGVCVDTEKDPSHCGRCDKKCLNEDQCIGSRCTTVAAGCTREFPTRCRDVCTNLFSDSLNCGSCNKKCAQICMNGNCVVF